MGSGNCGAPFPILSSRLGLSAHTAILPQLELSSLFNAINFSNGTSESTADAFTVVNTTVIYAQVSVFVCPSDEYAGEKVTNGFSSSTNSYFASLGTSTYCTNIGTTMWPAAAPMANLPTTGMFAFQQSYTFAQITDGLSNTIAFAESTVATRTRFSARTTSG